MTYAMMKKTTKWMPLWRHKRSQKAGVVYGLVDAVAAVDVLMRISLSAKRSERCAQLVHEELGLLPSREMAALVEPVVVNELRISPLCPAPRGGIDLVREGAHGDRDLDAPRIEEASARDLLGVPVEARRRDRGICQPVERDVVEDVGAREPLRPAGEDPRDQLLAARVVVEHPGRQADR